MDNAKGMTKGDSELSGDIDALDSSADHKLMAMHEYQKLPAPIKRRVRALKKLQYETIKVDQQFYKELSLLEAQYNVKHQEIFDKRREILSGEKEPKDEECDWPTDDEDNIDNLTDTVNQVKVSNEDSIDNKVELGDQKGIPEFWLTAMKNIPLIDEMIKDHDLNILKHLQDIKCILKTDAEPGFILEFYFAPNDYFTNIVLTKQYFFNYDIPEDPFEFEGPEVFRTKGCVINWKPNKNVTVKLIKKVQKQKGGGAKRTITKSVQDDSFFNFFQPPTESISDDLDEDTEMLLEADFKIGQFIRESLIPRSVLFFTGEAIDPELDEDDDEYDEDDDDEDYTDEEDDQPVSVPRRSNRPAKKAADGSDDASGEQPNCKTQ